MTAILTGLATVIALPVAIPLAVWTGEVWAGLRAMRADEAVRRTLRTTVLIPAHNEALGIARAIATLSTGDDPPVVVVVADNCTDDTAVVSRAAGARVIERHDPARRGKGFALAFGRDALAADPPDSVVIVDADCAMSGDDVSRLASVSADMDRAVQARNLQRPRAQGLNAVSGLSDFAFLVKNLVRQQGAMRLGRVAVLTGTGMAIPWADFGAAPLAKGDLAEDLALGVWLARRGRAPQYAPVATVWSDAVSGADLLSQRRRWEHGFVATARRRALPLVIDGLRGASRSRLWLGLHLLVPPLALLATAAGGAVVLTSILAALGASGWPVGLLMTLLAAAGGGLLLAWARYGREVVGGRALLAIPRYVLGKLPIYRSLFGGDRAGWQRTRRADE